MTEAAHRVGKPCLNCGAMPAGAWCQRCGQAAGPAHRSTLHFVKEMVELLTHADSRLWRTLRRLALDPAGLTRDYLLGRRMSQIPPLRLFLVCLLGLFAVGSLTRHEPVFLSIPVSERPAIEARIDAEATGMPRLDAWLKPHLRQAANHPEAVTAVMRDWLERFTLLMLPIAAALLWLLTIPVRPRFSFFDHLVFAIHSLSFAALVQIAVFLLGTVAAGSAVLLLLLPVHLFRHMRGVYGGGTVATLLRMALLGLGSLSGALILLLGLAGVGLQFGTG